MKDFQRCDVAESSHFAELESLRVKLRGPGFSHDVLTESLKKLPCWCDSLRMNTIANLVDLISSACNKTVEQAQHT